MGGRAGCGRLRIHSQVPIPSITSFVYTKGCAGPCHQDSFMSTIPCTPPPPLQAHEGLLVRIRCTPVGWLGLALRSTGPRATTVGCSPPRTNTQRMSLQHEQDCKGRTSEHKPWLLLVPMPKQSPSDPELRTRFAAHNLATRPHTCAG